NHAAMEVSTRVIVGVPKASIYATQARGMVAVHNRSTATVAVIDESLNRVANQPAVPQDAQIRAVPGGAAIADPAGGRAWIIGRVRLSEIESVEDEEAIVTAETPISMAVDASGNAHLLEAAAPRIWTLTPDGSTEEVLDPDTLVDAGLGPIEDAPTLTTVGSALVIVDRTALEIHVVEGDRVTTFDVGEEWADAILQQAAPQTGRVVAITSEGALISLSLEDGSVSTLGRMDGSDFVRPIDHDGTVYAVATNPPVLSRFGATTDREDRPLPGGGRDVRLRLVNGWIWANEATTGTVWSVPPKGDLRRADDWGVVLGTRTFDVDDSSIPSDDVVDEEYVEEPDNENAEIVSADRKTDEDGINDPPVAHPDQAATRPDRPVTIDVIANDEDPDGDVLLVSGVEGVDSKRGRGEPTADRSAVQFTPAAGFTGQVTFSYSIDDGRGGSATSDVVVDVIPLDRNEPPVAVTDIAATRSGSPVTINVLVNDSDPEGDPLVLVDVIAPKGYVSFTPDGQVVFFPAPDAGEARIDLTYTVADSFG
ncbi:MAG: cadherin-like domain-containing protein, partial [Actinomycetota bacterium]|nr:cadherin-like domain-containing protein [Actinomycetota bacterium]